MNEKYAICKQCEKFDNKLKLCKVCKCFMPVKTRLPNTKCPLGKWENLNLIKLNTI